MNVITVHKVSKKYYINQQFKKTFKERFYSFFSRESLKELYVLNQVSFSVKKGEVLGIIGKNGSGKSTLLKILSGITFPTSGSVTIQGKITSLLEVGTGFHEELTGRENVFLSGVMLGMSANEIKKNLQAIIEFAQVENYIDTPIKKYSSGMRLRLAFSVAAHLQTDILLIDEVLSVGDYEFEKKCMGVINQSEKKGKTILFVSHNAHMIMRLCTRALLLENGVITKMGNTKEVLDTYLGHTTLQSHAIYWQKEQAPGNEFALVTGIAIKNGPELFTHQSLQVEVSYTILLPNARVSFLLFFYNQDGNLLFTAFEGEAFESATSVRIPGNYKTVCTVAENILSEGKITVSVQFTNAGLQGKMLANNSIVKLEKIIQCSVKKKYKKVSASFSWQQNNLIDPQISWQVDAA